MIMGSNFVRSYEQIAEYRLLTNYKFFTFDMAITPSKFTALFLAVNKSSLHPEISSCQIKMILLLTCSCGHAHKSIHNHESIPCIEKES